MKKQTEMSVTINGKDVLAYPYTEKDYVQFENGSTIDEILENDLVSPTITHDETSFKVGVGDSDVSSSIVDSSVGKMVIKGQTYQNILPEPSTYVLSNDKEMFKVNEGLDENVEIVDSVAKGAVLKGRTLVNLASPHEEREVQFTRRWQTYNVINDKIVGGLVDGELIYMSMEINIHEINIETPEFRIVSMRDSGGHALFVKNFDELKVMPKNEWVKVSTIRTVNTEQSLDRYSLQCGMLGEHPTESGEQIARISFRKPMWINLTKMFGKGKEPTLFDCDNIPYFEGMQSVKMPILTTCGKNLFDMNRPYDAITDSQATVVQDTNQITVSSANSGTYVSANFILDKDFFAGKTVTGSCLYESDEKDIGTVQISYQDGNGDYHYQWIKTPKTFTFPNDFIGDVMLCVSANNTDTPQSNTVTVRNIQLELGSSVTPYYEPHKSNILRTPEEMVLKGLGDVQDTLNVNTGEYVQRIKEIVFTGEEDGWSSSPMPVTPNNISFYIPLDNHLDNTNNSTMRELVKDNLGFTNNCISATVNEPSLDGKKGFSIHGNGNVYFTIPTSECANLDAWKSRLRTQPLVLQYPVKNPTIKTVDLSTSGNWEKIVLDGSESWRWGISDKTTFWQCKCEDAIANMRVGALCFGQGDKSIEYCNTAPSKPYQVHINAQPRMVFTLPKDAFEDSSEFKQYLSQNPVTIWYQTQTQQDSTQVKQPIFFKDGHIIQSSGADNSLIPTLEYQAKTSNSYVMDLMKPNTQYTMKCDSHANLSYHIDGTSYRMGLNQTFTSPSAMPNKFMVLEGDMTNLMILEGNVRDKTIPYFKGIKSAFEDEDKIEVLSTGKNLVNVDNYIDYPNGTVAITKEDKNSYIVESTKEGSWQNYIVDTFMLKAKTTYTISYDYEILSSNVDLQTVYVCLRNHLQSSINVSGDCKNGVPRTFTSKENVLVRLCLYATDGTPGTNKIRYSNIQVEESPVATEYEPYKSNVTKIPLLSPLRSLSNGVYDEIILDRERNKAQITQKVKGVIFDGSESWQLNEFSHDDLIEFVLHTSIQITHIILSDRFITNGNDERIAYSGSSIYIRILKTKVRDVNSFKQWLSQNPTTVLYELQTPIITEVDLEGFPYIYKDGHIFLNSEIAPTTEITYSINQCQQISASNEDILRHEKELTYLQKLIAQYVQVDYESVLLSLKV